MNMTEPVLVLLVFTVMAVIFGGVAVLLPRIVAPQNPGNEKQRTYECGVVVKGDPWGGGRVQFYLFALVFLVLDVEALFLFPWALIFRDAGMLGFGEMLVFIGVLLLGWAFAWKVRAMEWE